MFPSLWKIARADISNKHIKKSKPLHRWPCLAVPGFCHQGDAYIFFGHICLHMHFPEINELRADCKSTHHLYTVALAVEKNDNPLSKTRSTNIAHQHPYPLPTTMKESRWNWNNQILLNVRKTNQELANHLFLIFNNKQDIKSPSTLLQMHVLSPAQNFLSQPMRGCLVH